MSNQVSVDLPENLTIATAEGLHDELEPLVTGSQDVTLNGAAVARVDTAGVQIIYSFMQALENAGASVNWEKPSDSLLEASEKLGMTEHLALKSV